MAPYLRAVAPGELEATYKSQPMGTIPINAKSIPGGRAERISARLCPAGPPLGAGSIASLTYSLSGSRAGTPCSSRPPCENKGNTVEEDNVGENAACEVKGLPLRLA